MLVSIRWPIHWNVHTPIGVSVCFAGDGDFFICYRNRHSNARARTVVRWKKKVKQIRIFVILNISFIGWLLGFFSAVVPLVVMLLLLLPAPNEKERNMQIAWLKKIFFADSRKRDGEMLSKCLWFKWIHILFYFSHKLFFLLPSKRSIIARAGKNPSEIFSLLFRSVCLHVRFFGMWWLWEHELSTLRWFVCLAFLCVVRICSLFRFSSISLSSPIFRFLMFFSSRSFNKRRYLDDMRQYKTQTKINQLLILYSFLAV